VTRDVTIDIRAKDIRDCPNMSKEDGAKFVDIITSHYFDKGVKINATPNVTSKTRQNLSKSTCYILFERQPR